MTCLTWMTWTLSDSKDQTVTLEVKRRQQDDLHASRSCWVAERLTFVVNTHNLLLCRILRTKSSESRSEHSETATEVKMRQRHGCSWENLAFAWFCTELRQKVDIPATCCGKNRERPTYAHTPYVTVRWRAVARAVAVRWRAVGHSFCPQNTMFLVSIGFCCF